MKCFKRIAGIRPLVVGMTMLFALSTMSFAQVSGANTFVVVSGGQLGDMHEGSISELAYPIIRDLWIVGGKELPGLKGRMQTAVIASTPERHGSITDLQIDQSEVFELTSKLEPKDEKMLRSYAGYYAINLGDVVPAKQLLKMVDEVSYGDERPCHIWGDKPMPIPIDVPCCKPLDAETLMKAFNKAGLVGDEGVLDEKGGLREGFLLIAFVPLPADGKETMAPGFGDRRKGGGGTLWVLQAVD